MSYGLSYPPHGLPSGSSFGSNSPNIERWNVVARVRPRDEAAGRVEARREVDARGRMNAVEQEVVGARPDELDGPLRRPRDLHGLERVVGPEPPAEAAADERHVHRHLLRRDAEQLRRLLLHAPGSLRRRPDLAGARFHLRDRVPGLERGVRLEGRPIARREPRRRGGERGGRVAGLPGRAPGAFRRAVDALPELFGRELAVLPFVPHGAERIAAGQGGVGVRPPGRRRRRRSSTTSFTPGDRSRLRRVVARELRAPDRADGDRREEHARHPRVEPVDGAARHDGRPVDAGHAGPDESIVLRVLQPGLLRDRKRRRRGDELAVSGLAARRRVEHGAHLRAARRGRDAPLFRGGLDQHLARRGARLAQRLPGAVTLSLPPVPVSVNSGPGDACSITTAFQSASSSSARIIASEVRTPWPISECATTSTVRPSAPMRSHWLGAKPAAPGRAPWPKSGIGSASAAAPSDASRRNCRRVALTISPRPRRARPPSACARRSRSGRCAPRAPPRPAPARRASDRRRAPPSS